ncbi:unnamed protein product [Cylicocyclus nassatus]|uniref:Uncharacterized protein n=1 Tax=Cylicocyclus nassatus TaxID=53992 RepID=A0AA36DQ52_CYLNA|nr:unnamed protein product [Cylicocyclus nassatus]
MVDVPSERGRCREEFFNKLSEARVVWSGHARIAIWRALTDIPPTILTRKEPRSFHQRKSVSLSKTEGSTITKELVTEKTNALKMKEENEET